jgi:RNA polymerase sigma-70 factor, ECF subfamily
MAQRQIIQLIERATDALPDAYRLVFVTRVIEGMSVEETAQLLGIKPETVKTRLHRARQLLREQLDKQIGPELTKAFPVLRPPCPACDHCRADAARNCRIIADLSSRDPSES